MFRGALPHMRCASSSNPCSWHFRLWSPLPLPPPTADALLWLNLDIAVTPQNNFSELIYQFLAVVRGRGVALDVVGIDGAKPHNMFPRLLQMSEKHLLTHHLVVQMEMLLIFKGLPKSLV